MSIVPEQWRPVVGYEGYYEVSNLGRVRSLPRVVMRSSGIQLTIKAKLIRPRINNLGYARVGLHRGPGYACVDQYIHILAAEAFIGPRPEGCHVLHGANGVSDNSVANLSYGTPAKNNGPDKARDGTSNRGSACSNSKLNEVSVAQIRARIAAGEQQRALAAEFGVSAVTISMIKTRQRWSWLAD